MAGQITLRVTGDDQVVRDLDKVATDLQDPKDALDKIADRGARIASSFAPHRSGRLAGGISGRRVGSGVEITAGGQAVLYAGPINYGWRRHNIAPALFLQRTDEQLEREAVRIIDDEIDQDIRKRGLR